MNGYMIVAHVEDGTDARPLTAFAALGADHHEAAALIRSKIIGDSADIAFMLHLNTSTVAKLGLTAGEVSTL